MAPKERWPVGGARVVAEVARTLLDDLDVLADRSVAETLRLEPAYASGTVPADDLWRTVHDNMELILRRLAFEAGTPALESLPAEIGRRRAEQGLPLDALLHAFRLDFRVVWEAMVDGARREHGDRLEAFLDGATRVWSVIDDISTAAVEAYRDAAFAIARRDERDRQALLDALIDGRDPEPGTARALDLPAGVPLVAVVATGLDRPELALRPLGSRSAWSRRAGEDVAVVTVPPTGVTALCAALAEVSGEAVGVSHVFTRLTDVAAAVRLARLAAGAGGGGVVRVDEVLLPTLTAAAPEAADVARTTVLGHVLEQPPGARRRLLQTARAYADGDGSVSAAATALGVHRNTVLNRLQTLERLTGRSLRAPRHLAELVVALDAHEGRSLDADPR